MGDLKLSIFPISSEKIYGRTDPSLCALYVQQYKNKAT